jgi:hypothetical protein
MPPDGTQEVSRIIAAAEEITLDPTVPASPSDALGEDDEIARLAALSLLAYEQEREAAAQRLACRVSVLDKLVAEASGVSTIPSLATRSISPSPRRGQSQSMGRGCSTAS